MISYAEALRLMIASALARPKISSETLPLSSALGRVCASAIVGRADLPPFDNSSMDGYAFASTVVPTTLPVLGVIYAGDGPRRHTQLGAWKIMTGAPIPVGCDTVVALEHCREHDGGGAIEILAAAKAGDHIRGTGTDFRAGAEICPAGIRLDARHLMALAAVGVPQVRVRRRPRIALIATGRELAAPYQDLGPGMIYDATTTYIAAACAHLGYDFYFSGVVADDAAAFSARMGRVAADGYDMVLTTGAVSMGMADFIPSTLQDMGAKTLFHKVAIKPGRPILFSEFKDGPLIFGLPGNPISSIVGMRFFVEPCLRALLGRTLESPIRCRLKTDVDKPEKLRCFLKALRLHAGLVEILSAQASFQIHSLLSADCWAVLPEGNDRMKAGAEVDVYAEA